MDKSSPILVTGATGFIGSYILRSLAASGYHNLTALRRSQSRMDLVQEIEKQVTWIETDLLDVWSLYEILKDIKGVIHAGAMVSFNPKEFNLMMKVNVEGTANVVNACLENDVEKLVHISSIAVFSREGGKQIINEDTPWDYHARNTAYAISKYRAEMEVWRGGSEGLSTAIINPSLVLGSGFWEETSVSLFKTVYKNLPFYPTGVNGFVDVRDVATAAIKLLDSEITNRRYIISAGNYSYKEVLKKMAEALDKRPPFIQLTKLIRELALFQSWIRGFFDKNQKVITRETLQNASGHYHFENARSIKELGMEYRDIESTIIETSAQLMVSAKNNFSPQFLDI